MEKDMTSVIFLDIDGVLNSNFWNDSHQMEISDGKLIDVENVKVLADLVDITDADLVLHSGWRFWFDENINPVRDEAAHLVSMLEDFGLSISAVTPDLSDDEIKQTQKFSQVKAKEISLWLEDNKKNKKWIVLDDLDLHDDLIAAHQIKTDATVGLTEEDVADAMAMWRTERTNIR